MDADLIHLVGLAKAFAGSKPGSRPRIILQPTTIAVPADRRVAVLGRKLQGKSVFLKVLSGLEAPTQGQVITNARLSPIVRPGPLFHPRLTWVENIGFYARSLSLDADQLAAAVDAYATGGGVWSDSPAGDAELRKPRELGLLTMLPFNCYLVDEIGHLADDIRERYLAAIAERNAGIIFTTSQKSLVQRYADCALVISNGLVHPFSSVEEAIRFHER
jgi:ABC-type polysaccharide/polyol phosphate transport system ATPase subunit